MTQDEIIRFAIQCSLVTTGNRDGLYMDALTEFAKLVAAKALAQEKALQALHSENERLGLYKDAYAEQEPVAYLCENAVGHKYFRWKKPSSTYKPIALYTTPPQRIWVGLTNNELQPIADEYRILFGSWVEDFARAIETKLKELNG